MGQAWDLTEGRGGRLAPPLTPMTGRPHHLRAILADGPPTLGAAPGAAIGLVGLAGIRSFTWAGSIRQRTDWPVETVTKEEPPETEGRERSMSFTRTVETSQTEAIAAPFPNTKGTVTLKVLNSDQSLGPAMAILRMEPGSEIARHLHERTTETSYVLDGEFINEGITYPVGTEWNVKPLTPHGPHTTKTGCTVLVTFSYPSALDDFKLA
jgi:ChrR-like protein with cupin domain